MTHKQWVKLTPEEQRIKVAELCGWSWKKGEQVSCCWHQGYSYVDAPLFADDSRDKVDYAEVLPNYLRDLNAMQQTHQVLHDAERFEEYVRILASLSKGHTTSIVKVAEATAEQQAEAFVLTMTQEEMK